MSRKEERLYWLKLHKSYFNQLSQKKMKNQKDGRVMQVIYLQMMLLSIDTEATIYYQGVFDTIEEELAVEFDESVELIKKTIDYLTENHLATFINKDERDFFLPEANGLIGSEGGSTERVRRPSIVKRDATLLVPTLVCNNILIVISGRLHPGIQRDWLMLVSF